MNLTFFPARLRRTFVSAALGALLTSCGGVQGEAESALTLSIAGHGSSYLAVQNGAGAWQPLTVSEIDAAGTDPVKVTLSDPQGRYGVVNVCLDAATGNLSVNLRHGVVFQTPVVSANCPSKEVSATVSVLWQLGGLAKDEYGNVYLGDASALVDSTAPQGRLELPAARYDLVASRYDGSARVPNRLVLEPGLAITGDSEIAVNFDGSFSFRPEVARLFVGGIRTGELLSGSVELVTPRGTAARVGEYTGGDALSYARIPAGLGYPGQAVSRGVSFRAEVQSFSYNDRSKAGSSRSVSRTFPNTPEKPLQLKLPEPLAPPTLTLLGDTIIRPQVSWQAHPAGTGLYTQFYSQIQAGHTVSYRLSQSSAWLKERAASYTLPDFSALPDWSAAWNLTRTEALFWNVSFIKKTRFKELSVSRSGVLTP